MKSGAKTRKEAKNFFEKHKTVKCPAFKNGGVVLNAKGLNHLFYKSPRSGRNEKEAESRVALLPRAVKLIELMPLAQEEDQYTREGKVYKFWAFEGVVSGRRIKVVVRQVGKGKKHLWSIIPAWRKSRFGIRNSKSNIVGC